MSSGNSAMTFTKEAKRIWDIVTYDIQERPL